MGSDLKVREKEAKKEQVHKVLNPKVLLPS